LTGQPGPGPSGGGALAALGGLPGVAPGAAAARSDRATLLRGIGVSGLNPKGLLVFLAVLPQFATPRETWPLAVQLGILGVVFTLTCGVFYLSMGSAARRIRRARDDRLYPVKSKPRESRMKASRSSRAVSVSSELFC
jgi:threonine/homoserine/homoserine lactone efflux protein